MKERFSSIHPTVPLSIPSQAQSVSDQQQLKNIRSTFNNMSDSLDRIFNILDYTDCPETTIESPRKQLQDFYEKMIQLNKQKSQLTDQRFQRIHIEIPNLTLSEGHRNPNTRSQLFSNIKQKSAEKNFNKSNKPTTTKLTKQNQIKKFLGKLMRKVLEKGFVLYQNGTFTLEQVKIYCSENILYSIIMLVDKNFLDVDDVQVINLCLKEQILPYFQLKYPISEEQTANFSLKAKLSEKNNINDPQNDMIYRSNVNFEWKSNGNYNTQIMEFFNFLIDFTKQEFKNFDEDMTNIFQILYLQDTFNQDKDKDNGENEWSSKINEKFQKKKEKVAEYTSFAIGQKLPFLPQFTKKQRQSGILKFNNSGMTRIAIKWCEELEKYFEPDAIVKRDKPFRMSNQEIKFIETKMNSQILEGLLKEEKKQIDKFLIQVKEHSNISQKQFCEAPLQQSFLPFSEQEARVGQFASSIYRINQTYTIAYLNKLIHGILSALRKFGTFIKETKEQKNDINEETTENRKDQSKKIEEYLERFNYVQTDQKDYQSNSQIIPSLISFTIGDIFRCKCSSKQPQILALYNHIQKLDQDNPQKFKIIRVKNRLQKGTRDVLINILYKQQMLVEMQLGIKSTRSQFSECSGKFTHYIYELKRADFGPINELCSIWVSKDKRSKVYLNNTNLENRREVRRGDQCAQIDTKIKNCLKDGKKMIIALPFRCTYCSYYYYDVTKIQRHLKIDSYFVCCFCQIQKFPFESKKQLLGSDYDDKDLVYMKTTPKIEVKENKKEESYTDLTDCLRDLPSKGKIKNIKSRKQSQFIKLEKEQMVYLFQQSNKSYQLIESFPKDMLKNKRASVSTLIEHKQKVQDFFATNVIIKEQSKRETSIDEGHKFILLNKLKVWNKASNNSIAIIGEGITENLFIHFRRSLLQTEKTMPFLEKLNLSENKISNIQEIIELCPRLKQLLLNYNQLKSLPPQINTLSQLTVLEVCNNQIQELPTQLYDLCNLKILKVSHIQKQQKLPNEFNKLKRLEELVMCSWNNLKQMGLSFENLIEVKKLKISNHKKLQRIQIKFQKLIALEELELRDCPNLEVNFEATAELSQKLHRFIVYGLKQSKQNLPLFSNHSRIKQLALSLFKKSQLNIYIQALQDLGKLKFQMSQLTTFPDNCFEKLKNLWYLEINECRNLNCLPASIEELEKLQQLIIGNNDSICELPEKLYNLTKLRVLEIRGCKQLESLPENLGRISNLKKIVLLNNCSLQLLPETFGELENLQFLQIKKCKVLKSLPDNFGMLKNLSNFTLQKNDVIKQLPTTFEGLQQLCSLQITSCISLQSLPKHFGNLQKLKTLILSNNDSLISLSDSSFDNLKNLTELRIISCQNLNDLSDEFGKLQSLECLTLKDNNKLKRLPALFGILKSLSFLQIHQCNRLENLSESFGSLYTLNKLILKNNESLVKLPHTFGDLLSLEKLEIINCNRLVDLSENFGNLPNLTELELSENLMLEKLPDTFYMLKKLKILIIQNCQHFSEFIITNQVEGDQDRYYSKDNTKMLQQLQKLILIENHCLQQVRLIGVDKLRTVVVDKYGKVHGQDKYSLVQIRNCKQLSEIGIRKCEQKGMVKLAQLIKIQNIQVIGSDIRINLSMSSSNHSNNSKQRSEQSQSTRQQSEQHHSKQQIKYFEQLACLKLQNVQIDDWPENLPSLLDMTLKNIRDKNNNEKNFLVQKIERVELQKLKLHLKFKGTKNLSLMKVKDCDRIPEIQNFQNNPQITVEFQNKFLESIPSPYFTTNQDFSMTISGVTDLSTQLKKNNSEHIQMVEAPQYCSKDKNMKVTVIQSKEYIKSEFLERLKSNKVVLKK